MEQRMHYIGTIRPQSNPQGIAALVLAAAEQGITVRFQPAPSSFGATELYMGVYVSSSTADMKLALYGGAA